MASHNITASGLFYFDGRWSEENPKIVGPATHAFWMASVAFDGARAFGGLAPDLDLHCQRLIRSAEALGLKASVGWEEIDRLSREGIRRLPRDGAFYIRPAIYAEEGFVAPDPESARFVLAILESPLPGFKGFSVCLSRFRRPARDMAPTDAKASALYPNSARALREAAERGFDNAVVLDPSGNVAELATANVWFAKDGRAVTPAANGTFLAGITRSRVMDLLREDGIGVEERAVTFDDLMDADEVFSTGNYGKVMPITRIEDREMQPGPVARRAYDLYMAYAEGCSVF